MRRPVFRRPAGADFCASPSVAQEGPRGVARVDLVGRSAPVAIRWSWRASMAALFQTMLLGIGLLVITASDCRSAETIKAVPADNLPSSEPAPPSAGIPADPPTAVADRLEVEIRLASEADISKGKELKPGEAVTQGFGTFVIQGLLTPIAGPMAAFSAVGGLVRCRRPTPRPRAREAACHHDEYPEGPGFHEPRQGYAA